MNMQRVLDGKDTLPSLLEFFGLRSDPFGVTPDPRYLFFSHTHREALASMAHGIAAQRGFMALIAEPGMGKTTLLFRFIEQLRRTARTAFLFQTQCDSREFLNYLVEDLEVDHQGGSRDVVQLHQRLNEVLAAEAREGRRCVVVIDEAQNLSDSVLETVRLLSDFETPQAKLLQIILAGQPGLADKLAEPGQTQLRQRISIVARLTPLNPAEVSAYITHRLEVAGYRGAPLFTSDAESAIAVFSSGIPRNINNLCFHALSLCCATGVRQVERKAVEEAVSDLDLRNVSAVSPDWPVPEDTFDSSPDLHAAQPATWDQPSGFRDFWSETGGDDSGPEAGDGSEHENRLDRLLPLRSADSPLRFNEVAPFLSNNEVTRGGEVVLPRPEPAASYAERRRAGAATPAHKGPSGWAVMLICAVAALLLGFGVMTGVLRWKQTQQIDPSSRTSLPVPPHSEATASAPAPAPAIPAPGPADNEGASADSERAAGAAGRPTPSESASPDPEGTSGQQPAAAAAPETSRSSIPVHLPGFAAKANSLPQSAPTLTTPVAAGGAPAITSPTVTIPKLEPVPGSGQVTSGDSAAEQHRSIPASSAQESLRNASRNMPERQEPVIDRMVRPAYPDAAREAGIEGQVKLRAMVGEDGHVRDVRVLSGDQRLASAAVEAVMRWHYRGVSVESPTTIVINFSLAPEVAGGQR